jgi:NAD(P)-dependent dehydrogenase (short-subunit alcohol dehydrogenase family)
MHGFAGEVAMITGGSRGLGLALARELANRGCALALLARDAHELAAADTELAPHTRVLTLVCDVSDRAAVERAVERTLAELGRIDLLVNNAAIFEIAPVASLGLDDFRQAMDIIFWGTLHATLAVLPHMRARKHGRICNITSIGGKVAVPHLLPYDCAKFATVGLSEGLHAELARDGITVTTIVPGLIRTGSAENAIVKGQHEREYAWFAASAATPLSSMSMDRAARRIVRAIARGESEVTLTWQAKLLRLAHAVAPVWVVGVLGVVNRLLPAAAPTGSLRARDLPRRSRLLSRLLFGPARRSHQYVG